MRTINRGWERRFKRLVEQEAPFRAYLTMGKTLHTHLANDELSRLATRLENIEALAQMLARETLQAVLKHPADAWRDATLCEVTSAVHCISTFLRELATGANPCTVKPRRRRRGASQPLYPEKARSPRRRRTQASASTDLPPASLSHPSPAEAAAPPRRGQRRSSQPATSVKTSTVFPGAFDREQETDSDPDFLDAR